MYSNYNSDKYFMDIACDMRNLSTCVRRKVGAVLVKDGNILSVGCNRTVRGSDPCTSDTCIRSKNNIPSGTRQEVCMATHAEQMAIIKAVQSGFDLRGAEIYVSDSPCVICARLICEFELAKVYYKDSYPDELSLEILNNAGIEVIKYKENVKKLIKE